MLLIMLFMNTPRYRELERSMTLIPNLKPKGHGMAVVGKFKYTAEMCDCKLCVYYKNKHCTLTECTCIKERIDTGVMTFAELLTNTFQEIKNQLFQKRLNQYIKESELNPMVYKDNDHKKMFKKAMLTKSNATNKLIAVLYLLTADKSLWSRVRNHIGSNFIDFYNIKLKGVNTETYTLYMTAKDIYCGTRHITVNDLADKGIIPPNAVICNALAVYRYGMDALKMGEI